MVSCFTCHVMVVAYYNEWLLKPTWFITGIQFSQPGLNSASPKIALFCIAVFCGMNTPQLGLCCDCLRGYQRKCQNRASIICVNRKKTLLINLVRLSWRYSVLIDCISFFPLNLDCHMMAYAGGIQVIEYYKYSQYLTLFKNSMGKSLNSSYYCDSIVPPILLWYRYSV